jgi:transposase
MRKMKLTASQRRKIRTRLRQTHDVRLYRRLLAVLEFDRGTAVSAIAELLGVSCQSVYNWIARFEQGGDGCELSDAPRSGRPPRAGEVNVFLRTLLILPPEWFGYYATHWTVPLLKNQLRQNELVSILVYGRSEAQASGGEFLLFRRIVRRRDAILERHAVQ